tara:strand:+ start:15765 stop:16613 length:849 start_codon:yes stop_codon:yes gene_type:complete
MSKTKNEYDISFFFPAIRTPKWVALYESLKLSCKRYKWELVLCGPFPLPKELQNIENVKHVKEDGCVSRAVQVGVLETTGKLIYIGNDDTLYREDAFDHSLDHYFKEAGPIDIMQATYVEGGNVQPNNYWTTAFHAAFHVPGIDQTWKLATEPIIPRDYFMEMGGFDCRWEYMDGSTHDFAFRAQRNGSEIIYSPVICGDMEWSPDHTGDHGPIHDAMCLHDNAIFQEMWSVPNDRLKIDYDNYKEQPGVWSRRFPTRVYESYEDLWDGEGYVAEYKPAPYR